jgi:hypothetical protein
MSKNALRAPEEEMSLEPPRSEQGGVHQIDAVRRADHEHVAALRDAVHLCEEGGDDRVGDGVRRAPPDRGEGIDLVEEQDGGSDGARSGEHLAYGSLRLADVLVEELGALDREERRAGFVGERTHDERLPGSGRAVEQQPPWRFDAEALEALRLRHLPDDGLGEPLLHLVEIGDALESVARDLAE